MGGLAAVLRSMRAAARVSYHSLNPSHPPKSSHLLSFQRVSSGRVWEDGRGGQKSERRDLHPPASPPPTDFFPAQDDFSALTMEI